MNNYSTAEEMKQKSISIMGQELGLKFHELKQELMRIFIIWGEYCCLYGKNKSRVELLNKSVPGFFALTQDIMWQQSLLSITRITDRARIAGKETLTIKMIPRLINQAPELHEKIEQLLLVCDNKTFFCRDCRNRKIAHNDVELFTNSQAVPLENGSRLIVKEALKSIVDVMNTVQIHYMKSTTAYDILLEDANSVRLLYYLDDALKMKEYKKELKREGKYKHHYFQYSFK